MAVTEIYEGHVKRLLTVSSTEKNSELLEEIMLYAAALL